MYRRKTLTGSPDPRRATRWIKPLHVPLDATNPFINPNQTLADIISDRNLGPLSTLKITDADLIIRNLNNKLNTAAKKNDQSTALLQRMDQHQKQIETQLAELKAKTKQLE